MEKEKLLGIALVLIGALFVVEGLVTVFAGGLFGSFIGQQVSEIQALGSIAETGALDVFSGLQVLAGIFTFYGFLKAVFGVIVVAAGALFLKKN